MMRAAWLLVLWLAVAMAECGTVETPCETPTGTYLLEQPEGAPKGAVVFLHGWGGSAQGTMMNRDTVETVTARGYLMVAPDGMPRGNGRGGSWSFHPDFPKARDEAAFFGDLLDRLASEHGVPRDSILFGGFSAGGFMTSYLACAHPDMADAWAPVSGGFWQPMPEDCAGPVRLLHVHGWTDEVVPLEGRHLRGGAVAQGDIFAGMELWRRASGCDALLPDETTVGEMWQRSWTSCAPGARLDFVLFPRGHMVPEGWADMALDWFEALPR